jgi:hypothetical protein
MSLVTDLEIAVNGVVVLDVDNVVLIVDEEVDGDKVEPFPPK